MDKVEKSRNKEERKKSTVGVGKVREEKEEGEKEELEEEEILNIENEE